MPKQKITKSQLIEKSISVFRTKGYYRTSMSDLAVACDLTKGAFYHHFKNKEEVMLTCLNATSEMFKNYVFSIAYNEKLTPKSRLTKMSAITFDVFTREKGGCYFANTILETAHVEDTFIDTIKEFFSTWEKAITHILSSKYSRKKAKKMSLQSISDIEGAILLMQLYKDKKYLKDALQRTIKLHLN